LIALASAEFDLFRYIGRDYQKGSSTEFEGIKAHLRKLVN
jgi:hypothetical protein